MDTAIVLGGCGPVIKFSATQLLGRLGFRTIQNSDFGARIVGINPCQLARFATKRKFTLLLNNGIFGA